MDVQFFTKPEEFRAWLEVNHDSADEVFVGFHRKASGLPTMTWSDSVDEALCFGWIDSVRRSIDDVSYAQRFTPRRKGSTWSKVNVAKVAELAKQGLMTPAGIAAFEARSEARTGSYSYENRPSELGPADAKEFKKHPEAWAFFGSQAPSYKRAAIWWVVSAKRQETHYKRLAQLILDSEAGRRLKQFSRPPKP